MKMPHPPHQTILCQVTGNDGRVYYRSVCRVCSEWIGNEKDLARMPKQELKRAYVTTEKAIFAARAKYLAGQAHAVYSKAWYEKKGVDVR